MDKKISIFLTFVILSQLSLLGCASSQPERAVKDPVAAGSPYQLGIDQLNRGLLKEAKESFLSAIKSNPEFPDAYQKLGFTEVKLGQYSAARGHLERVIDQYERDWETNFQLAEAYRGINQYPEAIYRYKKSLRLSPNSSEVFKPLAWSYFQIQDYKQALTIAKIVYRKDKTDSQAALILSRILIKLHRQKSAFQIIAAAKKTSSEHALAFFESVEGDIFRSQGKYKEAVDSYQSALKKQPLLSGSLFGLGECMLIAGETKKAISYGERALHLDPQMTEALLLLAKALESIKPGQSIKYYSKFIAKAGSSPEFVDKIPAARMALSQLRRKKIAN